MASEHGDAEPPTAITIDPRGNLLLVAGEAEQPILVSAQVLQVASEVFRAMLGPNFKEGTELAHHDSHEMGPYRLPLPDDNAEALTTLCKILHHKYYSSDSDSIDMDLLKLMMDLADKYDCTNALRYPASVWLGAKVNDACCPGHETLLSIAAQIDSPLLFQRISSKIIIHWQGSMRRLVEFGGINAIVLNQLQDQRETARDIIYQKLHAQTRSLQRHFTYVKLKREPEKIILTNPWDNNMCRSCTLEQPFMALAFHEQLIKHDLFPAPMHTSISEMVLKISLLKEEDVRVLSFHQSPVFGKMECGCFPSMLRLSVSVSEEVNSKITGLCLDCINAGGKNESGCRVTHK